MTKELVDHYNYLLVNGLDIDFAEFLSYTLVIISASPLGMSRYAEGETLRLSPSADSQRLNTSKTSYFIQRSVLSLLRRPTES